MEGNVANFLLIVHDTFLVARTRVYGVMYVTRCLHRSVWDQIDRHRLADGECWREKYAYYYYWDWGYAVPDDAQGRTLSAGHNWSSEFALKQAGHNWNGPFESRQEAFTHAYSRYGPTSSPNDFAWRASWRQLAAKTGLTIPVFVKRRR
jgi:hypothetical protein